MVSTLYTDHKLIFILYSIVDDLEFFKIRNKPIAPFVTQRLVHLEAALQSGVIQPPFNDQMNAKFQEKNFDLSAYVAIFQEVYQLALNKLKKHIDHHSALPLFKAIQCFDPQYIHAQHYHYNIDLYSEIQEFKKPMDQIMQECGIYCSLEEEFENDELDLDIYWKDKIRSLPNLSKLALEYTVFGFQYLE
jgi:hypothetical protein